MGKEQGQVWGAGVVGGGVMGKRGGGGGVKVLKAAIQALHLIIKNNFL